MGIRHSARCGRWQYATPLFSPLHLSALIQQGVRPRPTMSATDPLPRAYVATHYGVLIGSVPDKIPLFSARWDL